jgi:hypothetical protein
MGVRGEADADETGDVRIDGRRLTRCSNGLSCAGRGKIKEKESEARPRSLERMAENTKRG